MTLRIMLVGLVASLGFELPSGADVSSWSDSGRAWVEARMIEISGPWSEVKQDLAGASDCQQADEVFEVPTLGPKREATVDLAFEAASEAMTADFSADVLASRAEPLPLEELAPIVADAEDAGCLNVPTVEVEVEVAVIEPAVEPSSMEEAPTRVDRVSAAVRLTREAVQAWADLMQPVAEEMSPTH